MQEREQELESYRRRIASGEMQWSQVPVALQPELDAYMEERRNAIRRSQEFTSSDDPGLFQRGREVAIGAAGALGSMAKAPFQIAGLAGRAAQPGGMAGMFGQAMGAREDPYAPVPPPTMSNIMGGLGSGAKAMGQALVEPYTDMLSGEYPRAERGAGAALVDLATMGSGKVAERTGGIARKLPATGLTEAPETLGKFRSMMSRAPWGGSELRRQERILQSEAADILDDTVRRISTGPPSSEFAGRELQTALRRVKERVTEARNQAYEAV